jgi:hypothetical protein
MGCWWGFRRELSILVSGIEVGGLKDFGNDGKIDEKY